MRPAAGFTLIETLVALVVAATAASVVLALTHSHYRRAAQSRSLADAVTAMLNDSAALSAGTWREGTLAQGTGLEASAEWRLVPADKTLPPLQVENIEIAGNPAPPVGVAFTPFQRFGIARDGLSLWLIAPSLPPPTAVMPTPKAPADAVSAPQVPAMGAGKR